MTIRPSNVLTSLLVVMLGAACSSSAPPMVAVTLDPSQQAFLTVMAAGPQATNTPLPTGLPTGTPTQDWSPTPTTPPPPTLFPAPFKKGLQSFASPNFIQDIAVESDNKTVWVATTGGVLRWNSFAGTYDRFTIADGLPTNDIYGIYLAGDGKVWARTADRGLAVYDGSTWGWINEENGLPYNRVGNMIVTPEGKIWISSIVKPGGIYQYENGFWIEIPTPVSDIRRLLLNPDGKVVLDPNQSPTAYIYTDNSWQEYPEFVNSSDEMARTTDGRLWFIRNKSLFVKAGEGDEGRFFSLNTGHSAEVYSIAADPDGKLWVGHESGLSVITGDEPYYIPDPGGLPGFIAPVQRVRSRPNGEVWIGTEYGLTLWGTANRYVYLAPREPMAREVTAIGEGSDSAIWMGERSTGVYSFHGQQWEKQLEDFKGSETVDDIATSKDGSTWFVCPFDIRRLYQGEFTLFSIGINKAVPIPVSQLVAGKDGSFWAVGYLGIAKYQNSKWTKVPITGLEEKESVRSLAVDKAGTLWVATSRGYILRRESGVWKKFDDKDGLPNKNSGSEPGLGYLINVLRIDSHDIVWMGTSEGVYAYADGLWKNKAGFTTAVTEMAEGSNGRWYLGTDREGITILQDDRIVDQIRKTDGLASDVITNLFLASDGSIWIGTSKGVSRYTDSLP